MFAPLTQQTRWRRGACWFQLTIMAFCSRCHIFFSYIEFFITEIKQFLCIIIFLSFIFFSRFLLLECGLSLCILNVVQFQVHSILPSKWKSESMIKHTSIQILQYTTVEKDSNLKRMCNRLGNQREDLPDSGIKPKMEGFRILKT